MRYVISETQVLSFENLTLWVNPGEETPAPIRYKINEKTYKIQFHGLKNALPGNADPYSLLF